MKKAAILDFIKTNKLAVVSTVDKEGIPQSAVVEFGELEDLTIIIDTLKSSRKYKNLETNKNVSIVIGWDDDITVQINAIAYELSSDELNKAKKAYFKKNKRAKKWGKMPEIAYFVFKPNWIRYSDVSKKPWLIEELSF